MDNIDALNFGIDQIESAIEGAEDEEYIDYARKAANRLYRIMAHYKHLRDKRRK